MFDDDYEQILDVAEIDFLRPELSAALAQLPPVQHEAVELRVQEELGYPEIASRTDASEQVVRARVSRGLRALAEIMNSADEMSEESA